MSYTQHNWDHAGLRRVHGEGIQITATAPALSTAWYAVVIDGREQIPHLRFREILVDARTTAAVAALVAGEFYVVDADTVIRRVV
jgi:hypothetical protein